MLIYIFICLFLGILFFIAGYLCHKIQNKQAIDHVIFLLESVVIKSPKNFDTQYQDYCIHISNLIPKIKKYFNTIIPLKSNF